MNAAHQPVPRSTSTSDEAAVLLELPGDSLMVKLPPAQKQQPAPTAEPVSSMQQTQVEPEHPVRQQEVEQVSPVQQQKVEEPAMAVQPAKGEGSTQAAGAGGNRPEGAPPVPAQAAPILQAACKLHPGVAWCSGRDCSYVLRLLHPAMLPLEEALFSLMRSCIPAMQPCWLLSWGSWVVPHLFTAAVACRGAPLSNRAACSSAAASQ